MKYNLFPIKFNNVALFLCHCVIVSKLHSTPLALEIHSRHKRFTQVTPILSDDIDSFKGSYPDVILASQTQIF